MSAIAAWLGPIVPGQSANSKEIRRNRKTGKRFVGSSKAEERCKRSLMALALPHAPTEPLTGVLWLDVDLFFPVPASWPKWKRELAHADRLRPTSTRTPDLDNATKLLCDVLQAAGWLEDDARLVDLRVRAHYAAEPGYDVRVGRLEYSLPASVIQRPDTT